MNLRSVTLRHSSSHLVTVLSCGATLFGLFALGWILYEVIARGAGAINWQFFTQRTYPAGEPGGGVANAIVGTAMITGLAVLLGVPVGILGGVFLAEFGKGSCRATAVRFVANVLMGTPSIIVGVFVYTIVVLRFGYSAYAGAIALAILIVPLVGRTTEDILNLVPDSLRESALALGAPRWRVTLGVVFRAAKSGLLTGVLLAVARVSGETAPLLFTAMNNQFWNRTLSEPIANLTVMIYKSADSPYPDLIQRAWGASLLITVGVLVTTIVARSMLRSQKGA